MEQSRLTVVAVSPEPDAVDGAVAEEVTHLRLPMRIVKTKAPAMHRSRKDLASLSSTPMATDSSAALRTTTRGNGAILLFPAR